MKRLRELNRYLTKLGIIIWTCVVLLVLVGQTPVSAVNSMIDLGTLPGGAAAYAAAINDKGQIVGHSYTASGSIRAVLWEIDAKTKSYKIRDLGFLGGSDPYSYAFAINNSGQVAGDSMTASGHAHAFLWDPVNGMQDLGVPPGGFYSSAHGINDSGQIAGIYVDTDYAQYHGFLYSGGVMRDLGLTSDLYWRSEARAINSSGQITGWRYDSVSGHRAILYDGSVNEVSASGGDGYAINNKGQIAGGGYASSGDYHAYLYSDGSMTDLGTLGGTFSTAYGINNDGQVVGWSNVGLKTHAFRYSDGVMRDIGTLGGDYSEASGINNLGQIVGYSTDSSGNTRPFLWNPPDLKTAAHNLANVGTVSNQFTLWMDISYKHKADTTVCGKYKFKVVDTSDFLPVEYTQTSCKMVGNATSLANAKRYSVSFTIPSPFTKAASLTDATVYACNAKDKLMVDCQEIEELGKISAYGSTFDLKKHAWQVQNGRWKALTTAKTTTDFYRTGDLVDDYIAAGQKDNFWCSFMSVQGKCTTPNGLCYGLANSAISDFTHEGEAAWSTDGKNGKNFDTAPWKAEIDTRWDDVLKIAKSPFKPFVTDTIYNSPETWNGADKWTPQAAKKVLYHFVSQSSFLKDAGGATSTNWVGSDDDTSSKLNSSIAEADVISILQTGTPVSLGIYFAGGGGHQLTITQVLKWQGHARYTIWDNNYPYSVTRGKPYGSHFSWYIDDASNYPVSFASVGGNMFKTIRIKEGTDYGPVYTLGQEAEYLSLTGDSQNIYNSSDEILAAGASRGAKTSIPSLPRYPDHMELLIVGGGVTKVTERTTGEPVSLEKEGSVAPLQGTLIEGAHGLGTSLSLSPSQTYRVSVSKHKNFPSMKVFVAIPHSDGTVEKITYDNITGTGAEFLVGETNTQRALTLSRGTRSPTYRGILPTRLPAPSGFDLAYENEKVALTWTNPAHPRFDGVRVVRKESSLPESPDDGTALYQGKDARLIDSSLEKNKIYCYGVYSMNADDIPRGISQCIDTAKYTLSGALPGWGEKAAVTLTTASGKITHHAPLKGNGTYRLNNLAPGEYLMEVRPDEESEPSLVKTVTVEKNGRMEVR